MRRWASGYWLVLLIPVALTAQAPAPGLVRGTLIECEVEASGGEISVRTATHEVFRFTFDSRTYFEREKERTDPARLRSGEQVEVVADTSPGIRLRYARTVHVLDPPAPARPPANRARLIPNPIEQLAPRGTLTFSGIVFRINGERLVLRRREGGEQVFRLRADTRYLDSGGPVENSNLKANTRVYIRAGKDLYGEIEAYQIVWGEILQPNQP
jgi:hypothetical protein